MELLSFLEAFLEVFCVFLHSIINMGESEFRCFVGGLAWATTDGRLEDAFRQFGDVVQSKVISDRETGRSRGFGFVTFADENAMNAAIKEMNGKELDGRNITVNQAQSRGQGGGGDRSGGGGYSRSGGGAGYGGGGNGERYGGGRSYDSDRSGGYGGGRGGGGYGGGGGGGGYGGGGRGSSGSGSWRGGDRDSQY